MAVQSRRKATALGDSVGVTKGTEPAKIHDTGRVLGFLQHYFVVVLVVLAIAAACASEWLAEKTRFSSTVVSLFGTCGCVVSHYMRVRVQAVFACTRCLKPLNTHNARTLLIVVALLFHVAMTR
jgi:hypothetical protein